MKRSILALCFMLCFVLPYIAWAGAGDLVTQGKAITGTLLFDVGATIDEFSTDGTLGGDSDIAVPTEKAVKTYVDGIGGGGTWIGLTDTDPANYTGSHGKYVYVVDGETGLGFVRQVFNPVTYTDEANDTAKIQAAVTDAVAAKGSVYIPGGQGSGAGAASAGEWSINDADGTAGADGHAILVTGAITIFGDAKGLTTLSVTDDDTNAFYVATDDAVNFRDFKIRNVSAGAVSAGAGFYMTDTDGNLDNKWSSFDKIEIHDMYYGIFWHRGRFSTITNSIFAGMEQDSIYIQNLHHGDSGAHLIQGNIFWGDSLLGGGGGGALKTESHIFMIAAGGSRIIGNNFWGADYGIHVLISNDPTYGDPAAEVLTSVMPIMGNKFEGQEVYDIKITTAGGNGSFGKVMIVGNESCDTCRGTPNGHTNSGGIWIGSGGTADQIFDITIADNVWSPGAITIGKVTNITITGNVITKNNHANTIGIEFVDTPAGDVVIAGNAITGFTTDVGGAGAYSSSFKVQSPGVANIFADSAAGSDAYIRLSEAGVTKGYLVWDNTDLQMITTSGNIILASSSGQVDIAGTLNTGQGDYELYGILKDLLVNKGIVITNGGNNALYGPDGDITFSVDGNLEDLDDVGVVPGNSYFLVGSGAGNWDYETTTTVRTSLGLGTGNNVQFAGVKAESASAYFWTEDSNGGGTTSGARMIADSALLLFQNPGDSFNTIAYFDLDDYDLHVTGNVFGAGGCCSDYVFEDDYDLMPLDELQDYVKENHQLPGMDVDKNKVNYSERVVKLLAKIEEQALYVLQLHSRIKALEQTLN